MVHRGLQIHDLFVAPISGDDGLIFFTAARAAAIVHRDDYVAVGREQLALEVEGVLILPVWPAVNAQERGILFARLVIGRLHDETVNLVAVLGFATELLGGAQ